MAVKYTEITPYLRGIRPKLAESDRNYLDQELQKIEAAIRQLNDAIAQLRTVKANAAGY
jgi:prefoldin subunit 5